MRRLKPTYEGWKPTNTWTAKAAMPSLKPTYEGWKQIGLATGAKPGQV